MKYSPQKIVFFIDRCLGNSVIADQLKKTGVTVEIHDDHFPQNALDINWLPEVGKKEWIILTKDAAIGKNQLERLAVAQAGIRMFAFAPKNLSGDDMATILLKALTSMLKFIEKNPAPFIAKIYRDGSVKEWKDQADLLNEIKNLSDF